MKTHTPKVGYIFVGKYKGLVVEITVNNLNQFVNADKDTYINVGIPQQTEKYVKKGDVNWEDIYF